MSQTHIGDSWLPALSRAPSATSAHTQRAAFALGVALATGVLTQALFWRTGFGLNYFLWTLVALGACLVSVRPRRLTAVGYAAIAAVVLLGFSVVRFAGQWALAIGVPTSLAILAVLPLLLRDQVRLDGVPRATLDAVLSLRGSARAAREASRIPGEALGRKHEGLMGVVKGLAIGLPVAGVFMLLLSADVDFRHMLSRIGDKLGDATCFAGWSLVTAAGALFTHALFQRPSSVAVAQPAPIPYRHGEDASPPRLVPTSARVAPSTWLLVIGQVTAVFGLFVAVNVKNLFGGASLVRAPGSLTYAKYLHAGFSQLLCATVLAICLVAIGHRLLRPSGASAALGPVPGGRLLAVAECSLLGVTAVTALSCAQRLAIYEDAYGATRLRLGVAFVLLTVLAALGLTAVKVVRRGWRGYGGALASLVVGLAVVATSFNADAYVARTNLDRAGRGMPLDAEYLESLSVDAAAALNHPQVTSDAELASGLRAAYCTAPTRSDWRAIRGLTSCRPRASAR